MSTNMKIWDQVSVTDPEFTKESGFGRKFTSISPQYQLREATKVFGPYGKGFGFESCDIELIGDDLAKIAFVKAVFFYVDSDGRHTFPINNTWSAMAGSAKKNTLHIDEDFAKKAETNTMSKALSKLGFSADVFMGQFDDHEYVSMVSNQSAIDKAEDKIAKEEELAAEYREKCAKEIETIKTSTSINELEKWYKEFVRRAKVRNDMAHAAEIKKATTEAKEKLNETV